MNSTKLQLAQIAWVVPDIKATKAFFENVLGIKGFNEPAIVDVKEYKATYYDKKSEAKSLVSMAYSGGTFIELIQCLSGESIFDDYIKENPAGGFQHIAYKLPVEELDEVIAHYEKNGFPIISSFDTPIAKIMFFDTRKEIGVCTEIMGITKEGVGVIEKMKANS